MPIGQEEIFPAVVVVVEKTHAKTEILAVHAKAGLDAGVLERAVSEAVIQSGYLFGKIGAHDVEPAIAIKISDSDPHSR